MNIHNHSGVVASEAVNLVKGRMYIVTSRNADPKINFRKVAIQKSALLHRAGFGTRQ